MLEIPIEARCEKAVAHDFRDVASFPDASVEVCVRCSKKMVWRQDETGRMDNRKYLRAHFRSFVQPFGVTGWAFAAIWGEARWREAVKQPANREALDWDRAADEAKKMLRELQTERTMA